MKIKIVFGALLAGALLACSDEVAREKTNPVLPEGTAALKITFSTGDSGSGLKSYADEAELKKGLEAERQIDSVRIYVFDNAGILEQIVMVKNTDLEDASSGDAKEATVLLNVEGEKDIVAIANPGTLVPDESVSPIGMTYSDFEKLVTTPLLRMPAAPFVMYGIATNQTLTLTQETPVAFELSRIVARVDIVNRDSTVTADPAKVTTPFVLEKARLAGVYTSAKFNGAVNTDGEAFSGTPDWVDNPNATYKGTMRHALYAFPTPANNAVLELSGTYDGQQAFYQVKFGTLALDANHLYTVFIDSMTTTTVNATILVTDWANDTIDYQPVTGEYLSVTSVVVSNSSTMSFIADATVDPATVTDTVRMTSLDEETLTITVGSSNLAANFFSSVDWITQTAVEPLASDSVTQTFTLKIDKNTRGNRKGIIAFQNPQTPIVMHRIYIEQPGLALGNWATSNLTGYKTPTQFIELTDAIAGKPAYYGAWFQWGRNAVFTNTTADKIPEAEANLPGPFAPTASEVGGTNFITATVDNNYVWYTDYSLQDTWRKITGQTQSVSLGTDPCPDGWRLPTADEIAAIMPINGTVGAYAGAASAESTTATYYTDEGTQVTADYSPASYFTGGSTIRYGIKQSGTANAAIFIWEYNTTYLKVSSMKVSSSFAASATTIPVAFSGAAADEVVVRYFPAAGCRRPPEGTVGVRGTNGLYWSSSSHSSASQSAWSLSFNSGYAALNSNNRGNGFSVRCVSEN